MKDEIKEKTSRKLERVVIVSAASIIVGLFLLAALGGLGWIGYRYYVYQRDLRTYHQDWATADAWRKHCEKLDWNPNYPHTAATGANLPAGMLLKQQLPGCAIVQSLHGLRLQPFPLWNLTS
jgi:hypothetical protein